MEKHALLVAPGNVYQTLQMGRYAPLTFSGFNIERITLKLVGKGWKISILQDQKATKDNVLQFFNKPALRQSKEVLFYYCGHGDFSIVGGTGEPVANAPDEFLVLYHRQLEFRTGNIGGAYKDFFLTDNELTGIVKETLDRRTPFNLVLDCCHAAGMVDSAERLADDSAPLRLFASSTEDQRSFANSDTSFFTEALLMASGESMLLEELKRKTQDNLARLLPTQRSIIVFNKHQNQKANFI